MGLEKNQDVEPGCYTFFQRNLPFILYHDQLDQEGSLADVQIICQDGHIPVHRCLLTAASGMMKTVLENVVSIEF